MARQRTRVLLLAGTLAVVAAACGDDSSSSSTTGGSTTTSAGSSTTVTSATTTPGTISADRCAANKAAGTITYLTGFDFAAAASIVEVIVAQDKGYFEALCLDVKVTPSFSTANYPFVAANDAQFSSAGNFTELAEFATENKADLVALSVDGRTAIDTLIAKADDVSTYDDLKGKNIGIKGKLPPSIKALLAKHGLVEGTDFKTVLIDGFDPTVHINLPGIVAFPGWKSNEPGILERAGDAFNQFDPTQEGIPGSFGLIYTNRKFLTDHPTAAEDFMRAAMKGLETAIADPTAAAQICVDAINANGNKNFLSAEGETFRWKTEAALIMSLTPAGTPYGMPDPTELVNEIATYAAAGAFAGGATPSAEGRIDTSVLAAIYDSSGKVIWPS